MGFDWNGLGMAAATAGISTGMGLINNAITGDNYEETLAANVNASKDLAMHNSNLAYEQWKRTGVGGQVKEMKKAGLNVGLMYGGNGAGGGTAQASTPTVSGTPYNNMPIGMDIAGAMRTAAEIDLIEAEAENKRADTENKRGIEREEAHVRIESLTQGVSNMQTEQALTEIQTTLKQLEYQKDAETYDDRIKQIKNAAKQSNYELNIAKNDSNLSDELYNEKVSLVEQELTNSVLQSKQIKANINLTEEQTRKITVELAQAWESLTLEDERNKIEKFKAKTNAILGRDNLKLREREMIINGVSQTLGTLNAGRRKTTTRTTDKYDGDGNHQGGTVTTETR